MRILSVTAQKPHSTGSGTYLTEIVRSLDRAGHEQAVVAGIYEEDLVHFPQGVEFYPVIFDRRFPIAGMSDVMPYPSQLYSRMNQADVGEFEVRCIPVVDRAIKEFKPDIIFCHHLFLLTAMIRRDYPYIKTYGLCHGSDLRQFKQSQQLRDFLRKYIPRLDRIYALHNEQRQMIEKLYGIPADDIRIAGSGYNSEVFNTKLRKPRRSSRITISYAGKLSKAKGIEEFMEACELLEADESFPEFRVLLAGGEGEESVKQAIDKPYVTYFGMLNQKELSEMLQRTDVFVLPSYYEGLPLVLMEAMACGAVPVCTDLPGIREWIESTIDGSTAIFVERPEMWSVDRPMEHAKPIFARNLAAAIKNALDISCALGRGELAMPDIEAASWDSCASRIFTE